MAERRAARRYGLFFPVVVDDGKSAPEAGQICDVSAQGAYLVLNRPVNKNSDLDLTLVLPTNIGAEVLVQIFGKAVRVEQWTEAGKPRIGVGLALRRFEFARKTLKGS
jgi:PilZ domain